jgi:hypothetical protein
VDARDTGTTYLNQSSSANSRRPEPQGRGGLQFMLIIWLQGISTFHMAATRSHLYSSAPISNGWAREERQSR